MGVCQAASCVKSCVFEREVDVIGNKIFQPLVTEISSTDYDTLSVSQKEALTTFQNDLITVENKRQELAQKFEQMLYETGACVLRQPNLERAMITYLIFLLTKVQLSAKEKGQSLSKEDFSLSNFISLQKESPFITFNQQAVLELKDKYGFHLEKETALINGKNSIFNFLSAIPEANKLIGIQVNAIKELIKNGIEDIRDLSIVSQIKEALVGIMFVNDLLYETISSIGEVQSQIMHPRKLELFLKISKRCADEGMTDPREIAFNYAEGEKCNEMVKWKENITYKEVEKMKY